MLTLKRVILKMKGVYGYIPEVAMEEFEADEDVED